MKKEFIMSSIQLSKEYEIDMDTIEEEDFIKTFIYFECYPINGRLKELFVNIENMADEL